MTMRRRLEGLERLERQKPPPKAQGESAIDGLRAMLGLPPQTEDERRSEPPAPDPSDTRTAAEKLQAFLAEAARERDNMEGTNDP
tara:strand:+ start:120 stop:374 length:255 start_codon:yes stop_codon:yes gene_type:complete